MSVIARRYFSGKESCGMIELREIWGLETKKCARRDGVKSERRERSYLCCVYRLVQGLPLVKWLEEGIKALHHVRKRCNFLRRICTHIALSGGFGWPSLFVDSLIRRGSLLRLSWLPLFFVGWLRRWLGNVRYTYILPSGKIDIPDWSSHFALICLLPQRALKSSYE